MKRRTLQLLILTALSSSCAMAQINCQVGSASTKLACEYPFAVGAYSNLSALGPGNTSQNAQVVAQAIDTGIATQVSQLPLATASAGTVLVYKDGVPQTLSNLGPVLADRANTLGGKGKFYLGATGSQFVFTDIDGKSLKALPFAFSQNAYDSGGNLLSTTYNNETADLNFKVDQFLIVGTVGLSKTFDVSVIVPIERVSVGVFTGNATSYVVSPTGTLLFKTNPKPTLGSGTASGLGDVALNLKSIVHSTERATFAGGFMLRMPTGDDANLLGSGAFGFNPYLVFSYLNKVSPHAKIGYQWNSATELNNPTVTKGGNKQLPGGLQYDLGADWAAKKWLTVAVDLLGNQFMNTPSVVTSNLTITGVSTPVTTSSTQNSSYSIGNVSTGVKVNPFGNLVLSANLLTQINNAGLRSRPTPLIGISYKF